MRLFVNEILLNDCLRDIKHAASVISFTHELNNEKATYNKILQDLIFYKSYIVSPAKGEIKNYRIKD